MAVIVQTVLCSDGGRSFFGNHVGLYPGQAATGTLSLWVISAKHFAKMPGVTASPVCMGHDPKWILDRPGRSPGVVTDANAQMEVTVRSDTLGKPTDRGCNDPFSKRSRDLIANGNPRMVWGEHRSTDGQGHCSGV